MLKKNFKKNPRTASCSLAKSRDGWKLYFYFSCYFIYYTTTHKDKVPPTE